MNESAKEYVKDYIDPNKLSYIFYNAYNMGSCTVNRVIVLLVLLHMRMEAFQSFGIFVYNFAHMIYISFHKRP